MQHKINYSLHLIIFYPNFNAYLSTLFTDRDSTSYMAYFKRATTWLALGKSKAALPDLNKSIKLKPDFSPALVSKASILLKQGFMEDAKKYFQKTVR